MCKTFYLLILCLSASLAEFVDKDYELCGEDAECVEKKLITVIDKYDGEPSITILGGTVTVEKIGESQSATKDEGILERMSRYFACHDIKLKIPSNLREAKSFVQETRSRKLKKIILPVLLLLKLKAAIVIPAVLSAIALVAFKGLGAGLVALALSGATALKSLLEGQGTKKVSFEVVPPTHWNRAGYAPPSGPAAAAIPASLLQEWPLHGYQTLPQ